MSRTFSGVPWMTRDLSRPMVWGIMGRKGLFGGRSRSLFSDRLMGEDFARSRYTRVLSASMQRKSVHKDEHDMNVSLQAWHTWVNVVMSRFLSYVSQNFGMRMRISGGILLIGASTFLMD